ncbi:family 20 glycosylhydrolase [Enterobacteriaceae bacterium YMB-R22]|jgi:hexosaminidase|uniref:beta-N-acetylhexosaminidase n=1 Tax=Tenebrionicola larvae TaxID=2815733 RepID=UPI0020114C54|nr:family 20 glycosylhydrolase [Tenebrionicola larvae]MBV4412949.1 family 20 glycosylhydrolase [Tenebrionicola larvae]
MFRTARYAVLLCGAAMCFSALAAAPAGELSLMPWPKQVQYASQAGRLELNNGITINVEGDQLDEMVTRWRHRIALQTGWTLQPQSANVARPTIWIDIAQKVDPFPKEDSDESYRLSVSAQGIKLNAATRFGALRGMETVLQLIRPDANGVSIPWLTIEDSPRFAWRGLLLDSARHFLPVSTIMRQLDGMAAAKFNVLHWHLTDDQGWRFASAHYPRLQHMASDDLFYTQAQMREVVRYAARLGIRVVPEIDLPGHASAIAVAYPELMSAPGPYQMERRWGVLKPVLDPTNEAVYQFVDTLVGEVAAIFPDSYMHIGGDEVDDTHWKENPRIQQFMQEKNLADSRALQAWFNQRLETILEKHHRRMVGWDEIFHPSLPKNILIQSWQGQDALGNIANADYRGILSTGFYLDQPQSAAYHYRNEVWPQGLNGVDNLTPQDKAQSWSFTMPRLKGSAVEGSFTLIAGHEQQTWRGFVDFNGKSRRAVRNISWINDNQVTFSVDTWMGEVRPVLTFSNETLSGYFLVGNVRYPVSGKKQAAVPKGIAPTVPSEAQMANIIGGEAALWAENVVGSVLDIKLWPRAFTVAERLWSAKDVNNEDNMYQRMQRIDAWSTISAGTQQHGQALSHMMRLTGTGDVLALQILAQALEPAQYYTRHHLKYQAGNYHQFEPLNRMADGLAPESMTVRQIDKWVDRLIADREDRNSELALQHVLIRWRDNVKDVMPLIENNYVLKPLKPVVEDVNRLSELGLRLAGLVARGESIDDRQRQAWQRELDAAAQVRDEVVIAVVYPLEKLLRAIGRSSN